MEDKDLVAKIEEWLMANVRECPDIPENISLKEDAKRLLKFIRENKNGK